MKRILLATLLALALASPATKAWATASNFIWWCSMRLKIIAVLLAFLFPAHVNAAWMMNDGGDSIVIADSAALDLPDGDWTIFGRFRQKSNAGTGNNVIFGYGASARGVAIRCNESSAGVNPDDFQVDIGDGTETEALVSAGNECLTTTWQTFMVTRTGGGASSAIFTLYLNNSVVDGPQTDDTIDDIGPVLACIGRAVAAGPVCHSTGSNNDAEFAEFAVWASTPSRPRPTTHGR